MGIDRPDDGDIPAAPPEPREVEQDLTDGGDRHEYHAAYRATVDAVYQAAARERWEAAKPGLAEEWRHYADRHSAPPAAHLDIDEAACAQVELGCKEIPETEENIVTPAMVCIEAEDPERKLVGLEFRCKGQDRIMQKVAAALEEQPNMTPEDALASVKDAIRYTFQYTEEHYTEGVRSDVNRLKASGFDLVELRNSWGAEEYKGINSRWRVPDGGMLFEVQFHTAISFEAKQLTHQAYERVRNTATAHVELPELRTFQRSVYALVPHPSGASEIQEHP